MKIGILTFHKAHNYGAVLQAYGLKKKLELMGHSVSFVDYAIPSMLIMYYWRCGIRSLAKCIFSKEGIYLLLSIWPRKKRYNKFIRFTKQYFNESKYGTSKLDEEYDVIIVGSDQVFNANITNGVNNAYWGCLPSFSKRIITYAASTRPYSPTSEQARDIANNLRRFSALSVREPYTAEFLRQYTEKSIDLVLDPTLLLDKEMWNDVVAEPIKSCPYMFYYYLDEYDCDLEFARRLSKEKGLRLVVIGCKNKLFSSRQVFSSGPSEFLSLIKNAEYVLTSSFHCTVFSIVFNKQFSVLPIKGAVDYRLSNLLEVFGLSDRMITDSMFNKECIRDWNIVNNKLKEISKSSVDFLMDNLL